MKETQSVFPSSLDINTNDVIAYDYVLPDHLIATTPNAQRETARLLVANPKKRSIQDTQFTQITDHLDAGDLLVFNDTKVLPARIYTKKQTGGKVEFLVLGLVDEQINWHSPCPGQLSLFVMTRTSKALKTGQILTAQTDEALTFKVIECTPGRATVQIEWQGSALELLDHLGKLPLPPYIVGQRKVRGEQLHTQSDDMLYQTVFAKHPGAVAAPTASLHFSQALLDQCMAKGVNIGFVTLHVGIGTFKPVTAETLDAHPMHEERYVLSEEICNQLKTCKAQKGRVIAVGTTTARVLEARAHLGFEPCEGTTDIFLRPGQGFAFCDGLITNFHLPRSTLLALVASATGYKFMREIYTHAVLQEYQFYSYGDGMFITSAR